MSQPVSPSKAVQETPIVAPQIESVSPVGTELVESLAKISANLDKITDKLTKNKVQETTRPYFKYLAYAAGLGLFAAYVQHSYPFMAQELIMDAGRVANSAVQVAREAPSVVNTVKEVGEAAYTGTAIVGAPIGVIRNAMSDALDLNIPHVVTESQLSGIGISFITKAFIIEKGISLAGLMMSPIGDLLKPVVGEGKVGFVSTAVKISGFFYSVITSALPVPISEVAEAAGEKIALMVHKVGDFVIDMV